jgi:short-subunit dehydrogenase
MGQCNNCYSIVTGASQGLGLAFSEELAANGHNLILAALPNEGLQRIATNLSVKYNVKVEFFETDFAKQHSVYDFAEWVNEQFEVDHLINNVGIGGTNSFRETSVEYLDTLININIRTPALLTKLLFANLNRKEKSFVLNVASMASFSPIPYKTIYPASKAFVYFFSRTLFQELRGSNIFVSVVHPGPMMTNERVSKNIVKQGLIGKIGLLSTRKIAQISIRQLHRRDSLIILAA